jgi:hypothetical protein
MALSRFAGGVPVSLFEPIAEHRSWPFSRSQGTFIFSLLNVLTQLSCKLILCLSSTIFSRWLAPLPDAVTTALAGAQALRAVNHSVSLIVGIVVVSVSEFELDYTEAELTAPLPSCFASCSQVVVFVLAIFGYKWVHHYERYSWIVCSIIYFKGDYQVRLGVVVKLFNQADLSYASRPI